MGVAWAQNLIAHPEVELVGWVDIDHAKAAREADTLAIQTWIGPDVSEALHRLQPDFVVDVTPPEVHRQVTLQALSRGVPVLGEKPMADSLDAAREMVAAADAAGRLYMVSQSRRYVRGLHRLRAAIQQLGELGVLHVDFMLGPHFGGFRDAMAHPLLLDMAIHTFDAARFLSGLNALSVYADAFNPRWSWYAGPACAHVLFEFEGGIRFAYRGSWCAEGASTSWEGCWRAVASQGTALWDGRDDISLHIVVGKDGFLHSAEVREAPDVKIIEGIQGSLAEFLHALDTGTVPMEECHENFRSLAMVFAAIESAEAGVRVPVARA